MWGLAGENSIGHGEKNSRPSKVVENVLKYSHLFHKSISCQKTNIKGLEQRFPQFPQALLLLLFKSNKSLEIENRTMKIVRNSGFPSFCQGVTIGQHS